MDLCTFYVHGERYGVPILTVEEIFRPLPVTAVPGCHHWISGLMSLRGQSAVVLDLRSVLPRADSPPIVATDGSRMILLEQSESLSESARELGLQVDDEPLVLQVDHVGTMCTTAGMERHPPPAHAPDDFITAVFRGEDGYLTQLDIGTIVRVIEGAPEAQT